MEFELSFRVKIALAISILNAAGLSRMYQSLYRMNQHESFLITLLLSCVLDVYKERII